MPEQVWRCSVCKAVCDSEALALECESKHSTIEQLSIISVQYEPFHYYWSKHTRSVPDAISIRFGDWPGDHALYRLEHVGPKGV